MGGGFGDAARLSARVAIVSVTILSYVVACARLVFRRRIGWIFTSDDDGVVALLSQIAPLVALYQVGEPRCWTMVACCNRRRT